MYIFIFYLANFSVKFFVKNNIITKCIMTNFVPKIKVFYKYSLLNKVITNKDNILSIIYTGPLFSDNKFTKQIGTFTSEQLHEEDSTNTTSEYVMTLYNGSINFKIFQKTDLGKGILGNIEIGPVVCGSKRYLYWNSSKYSAKLKLVNNDDRTITIFKTCL